jgi:hypothetical protein
MGRAQIEPSGPFVLLLNRMLRRLHHVNEVVQADRRYSDEGPRFEPIEATTITLDMNLRRDRDVI